MTISDKLKLLPYEPDMSNLMLNINSVGVNYRAIPHEGDVSVRVIVHRKVDDKTGPWHANVIRSYYEEINGVKTLILGVIDGPYLPTESAMNMVHKAIEERESLEEKVLRSGGKKRVLPSSKEQRPNYGINDCITYP